MPEVAAVGRQSCLKDEPNPLGQIWNSFEGLHPVRDPLGTRGPQPDVDQSCLMEEILQPVEVVGRCGQ